MTALLCLLLQAAGDDEALAALRKLSEKFADLKTLSAQVTQTRTTALLEKPITSTGRLHYRREPARLVFLMTEPRKTEIHLDKASYQVHRPDERRLEILQFEGDEGAARLLMIFQPKTDDLSKVFTVRRGAAREGEIEVRLEPADDRVKKHLTKLSLTLAAADSTLRKISYVDAEGDEVSFELSQVVLDGEVPPGTFDLKVPEGTRVLRHTVKAGK